MLTTKHEEHAFTKDTKDYFIEYSTESKGFKTLFPSHDLLRYQSTAGAGAGASNLCRLGAPPDPPPIPPPSIDPIISMSGFDCLGARIPKYASPICSNASSHFPSVSLR